MAGGSRSPWAMRGGPAGTYLCPWRKAFLGTVVLARRCGGTGLAANWPRLGTRPLLRKIGGSRASLARRAAPRSGGAARRASRERFIPRAGRSRLRNARCARATLAARRGLCAAGLMRTRGVSPAHARQLSRGSRLSAKTLFVAHRRGLADPRQPHEPPFARRLASSAPPGTQVWPSWQSLIQGKKQHHSVARIRALYVF